MKKRFTFSLIMGKRLFLRPKDNISCFELGFISLLIYFHLPSCRRIMIGPGFLLRVLSFHFYSTCLFKRVNFPSNLFKKLPPVNIKNRETQSWMHDSFSWGQSFMVGSSTLIAVWRIWLRGCYTDLDRLFISQGHLAKSVRGLKSSRHSACLTMCPGIRQYPPGRRSVFFSLTQRHFMG